MSSEPATAPPPPLVVAASLAAVEGLVLVLLAVLEAFSVTGSRLAMGVSTALFFAAFGVLLMASAWMITHGHAWTRGPIMLAQLIQLGLAWNLRSAPTTVVAVLIALVAVVVIAGLVHPASVEALEDTPSRD